MHSRQLPKDYYDSNGLNYLRDLGVRGTRPGHMGRFTTFYSLVILVCLNSTKIYINLIQDVVEEYFGLKVISDAFVEGEHFIREKK